MSIPKNSDRTIIQRVLLLDLAGWAQGDIAKELGYTQQWISTIQTCPMYKGLKADRMQTLTDKVITGIANHAVEGDPVKQKIKSLAIDAIQTQETLMHGSDSDMVRASIADKILDRAGYNTSKEKTVLSVEVTEKMANRFERVLGSGKPSGDARSTTYRVEKEVSE